MQVKRWSAAAFLAACVPRAEPPPPAVGPLPAAPAPVPAARAVLEPAGRGAEPPRHAARLHFVDVGQGSALLVELSCAAVLVDLGGEKNDAFDGVARLRDYLEAFFARRPDLARTVALLWVTHPHIDHVRGHGLFTADEAPFRVLHVVTNGQTRGSGGRQQAKLQEWARDHASLAEVRVEDLPDGAALTNDAIDPIRCDDVDPIVEALWGALGSSPGWPDGAFENQNNHSVVLRLRVGRGAVLATGDLEEHGIASMIARGAALDADVWHVGHHGSHNGVSDELLAAATPAAAVISMGRADREERWSAWQYGHPRAATIDALERRVALGRVPVTVPVADGAERFSPRRIDAAVFATGWDGDVVLRLGEDGSLVLE
jgi:competence protein ComEC